MNTTAEQRDQLIIEVLEADYTVDHACGTAIDDPDSYEVAIDNIREMHRLLDLRAQRLQEALDRIETLEQVAAVQV